MEDVKVLIKELVDEILEDGISEGANLKLYGLLNLFLELGLREEISELQNLLLIVQMTNYQFSPKMRFLLQEVALKSIRIRSSKEPSQGIGPSKRRWGNAKEVLGNDTVTGEDGKEYDATNLHESNIDKIRVPSISMDRSIIKEESVKRFYDDGRYEKEYVYRIQPDEMIDSAPLFNNFAQKALNDLSK